MSEEELRLSEDALIERVSRLVNETMKPRFVFLMARAMLPRSDWRFGLTPRDRSARTRMINAAYEIDRIARAYRED